jgi:hypothetical protein
VGGHRARAHARGIGLGFLTTRRPRPAATAAGTLDGADMPEGLAVGVRRDKLLLAETMTLRRSKLGRERVAMRSEPAGS